MGNQTITNEKDRKFHQDIDNWIIVPCINLKVGMVVVI